MICGISEESGTLERDQRAMFRIPLHPWGQVQYLCTITIEQTAFRMLLDTGSPSLWVPSDLVDKNRWVGKNVLPVEQAPSLRVSQEFFYQLYGMGHVAGVKATVDMNLGGMLIRDVPFGMVMGGEKGVYDNPFDGVIGLGRRSICPENTNPVHHFFHQQGLVSRKFGFEFQDDGSSFMMGDNVEQVLFHRVTYINVVDGPFWETRVSWIFISNTGFYTEEQRMMFDTGTNSIELPGDTHMAINQVLGIVEVMDGAYVFDCELLPSLPPVTFQVQRKKFQIFSSQYTRQTTIDGDTRCFTRFHNVSPKCPVDIILGMSFLHSFQLIFDDEAGRVGFVPREGRSSIL
ncbi:eukaryotic aspartyl protease [Opisthorchis viverrini]|uniref:Eukaryotic aspartyl protease n=1 Tax=Opisthorchis viverrini TaxID=6198 RepID=A0A1S8WMH9_OPIVI|nr:eukaryotic aspartyl protease [Opisthorchis viverrini]